MCYLTSYTGQLFQGVTAKHPRRGEFVLKVLVKVNTTAMCSSNKHILISPINFLPNKSRKYMYMYKSERRKTGQIQWAGNLPVGNYQL